jgi:hypothetical protein
MGHSVGISDSYYRATENEILEDYLLAVDHLAITNDYNLQRQISAISEQRNDNDLLIKAKLSEKEKQIELLCQRDSINTDVIATLSDQLTKVMQEIEILKKQK